MSTSANLPDLGPGNSLPRDDEELVFSAPWEAHAFAIVVKLFEQGHYSWPEWVKYLTAEIAAAKQAPDPAQASAYYEQWLAAAEKLIVAKGLATSEQLIERKDMLAAKQTGTNHEH
jgi:nitrile hydratase accessory protein